MKDSSSSNNKMSNKVIESSESDDDFGGLTAVPVGKTNKTKKTDNWPCLRKLCTEKKDLIFKLLKAVDECDCAKELKCQNGDNPKGNSWNRLFDVCYGGGSPGRGLLAGELRKVKNASKLKQKVLEIWAYVMKESDTVDKGLVMMARRQEKEHEKAKADEKAAADKHKITQEKLQKDMNDFEEGVGAMPPGAKGIVGGGRRQHSTNLKANQPASYAYANATTQGDNVIDVDDTKPKAKTKPKASATTVNGNALNELKDTKNFMKECVKMVGSMNRNDNDKVGGKRKRELTILYAQRDALEKSMSFCQKFPNNVKMQEQLAEDADNYLTVVNKIQEILESDRDGKE
jgi:hypothetical protein